MLEPVSYSDFTENQIACFWEKVRRGSSEECWEWTANRKDTGYGRFMIRRKRDGAYRSFLAHRIVFYLANGPFNESLSVMHNCDNPACCNPAHLSLGTHLENMRDCVRKGSKAGMAGERNHQAKLTEDVVRLIRQSTGRGSGAALARRYGVTSTLISNIKTGKAWRHVA
jgi:hypothetical protein